MLIVEDIHDTGHTLEKLFKSFYAIGAKLVDCAVLVRRPDKPAKIKLNFCGLSCNDFIIGYGLDLDEWGRNLPEIYQKI